MPGVSVSLWYHLAPTLLNQNQLEESPLFYCIGISRPEQRCPEQVGSPACPQTVDGASGWWMRRYVVE
jgi:hypothetical protein